MSLHTLTVVDCIVLVALGIHNFGQSYSSWRSLSPPIGQSVSRVVSQAQSDALFEWGFVFPRFVGQ